MKQSLGLSASTKCVIVEFLKILLVENMARKEDDMRT